MEKKKRAKLIIDKLEKMYGNPVSGLTFDNAFQLTVAVILSAQCTDKRVNIVTSKLFKKFKTPNDFSKLSQEELERYIFSTGFYKNKAKNIINMSKQVNENFNGKIPEKMEDLLKLSGVGRKSANVIRGHIYNEPGVVVDTHVNRLSQRFGLTKNKEPEKIEKDLMKLIEKENWFLYSNLLIQHGRNICISRKPKCWDCKIYNLCEYENKID